MHPLLFVTQPGPHLPTGLCAEGPGPSRKEATHLPKVSDIEEVEGVKQLAVPQSKFVVADFKEGADVLQTQELEERRENYSTCTAVMLTAANSASVRPPGPALPCSEETPRPSHWPWPFLAICPVLLPRDPHVSTPTITAGTKYAGFQSAGTERAHTQVHTAFPTQTQPPLLYT